MGHVFSELSSWEDKLPLVTVSTTWRRVLMSVLNFEFAKFLRSSDKYESIPLTPPPMREKACFVTNRLRLETNFDSGILGIEDKPNEIQVMKSSSRNFEWSMNTLNIWVIVLMASARVRICRIFITMLISRVFDSLETNFFTLPVSPTTLSFNNQAVFSSISFSFNAWNRLESPIPSGNFDTEISLRSP